MYRKFTKPILDIFVAVVLIVLTLPITISTVILLGFLNRGKVLFIQKRPGKDGMVFTLIKFRTMNDKRDGKGMLLPDEQRLTKFGNLLRKFSIDELPQLLNVVKSEISIVGPRPLLLKYMSRYTPYQLRRHEVKPGITGLAQINGRNNITWKKKFQYDVYYVENQSFILDMKILFTTFIKVLGANDVSQQGHATVEEFKGE